MPFGGRSSETASHRIDMNMNNKAPDIMTMNFKGKCLLEVGYLSRLDSFMYLLLVTLYWLFPTDDIKHVLNPCNTSCDTSSTPDVGLTFTRP
jgi:hypothetical protein